MKTTLKTLDEFIDSLLVIKELLISGIQERSNNWIKTLLYKDFLNLLLELWMFIPCNSKGVPLEEPKDYKVFLEWKKDRDVFSKAYLKEFDEYQQALDRVIFKGFKFVGPMINEWGEKSYWIRHTSVGINIHFELDKVIFNDIEIKSIQDLCDKNVHLVDWKFNELNLK